MIPVEPQHLIFIYAACGVAAIFLTAFAHTVRRSRRERAALRDLMKCSMCAFHFRNVSGLLQPRCPNCGALVEQRRPSSL